MEGEWPMRTTYDSDADAAYIYLAEEIGAGGVAKTVAVDPTGVGGMIHLDFDRQGHLIGVEILDASSFLPPDVLGGGYIGRDGPG
jgi:uncharacterized protein YuzE